MVTPTEAPKLRGAFGTYAPIEQTCPPSCPLKAGGCYGREWRVGRIVDRLERQAQGMTPLQVADAEARLIRALPGTPAPLRLHIAGDARTNAAARRLASAVRDWQRRGGGRAWSYTHAWDRVARSSWGSVSVLASCESPAQVADANARGYAAALIVESFDAPGIAGGVPCPWQTIGTPCVECRLCWDDAALLKRRRTILFQPHGGQARAVRAALVRAQGNR